MYSAVKHHGTTIAQILQMLPVVQPATAELLLKTTNAETESVKSPWKTAVGAQWTAGGVSIAAITRVMPMRPVIRARRIVDHAQECAEMDSAVQMKAVPLAPQIVVHAQECVVMRFATKEKRAQHAK